MHKLGFSVRPASEDDLAKVVSIEVQSNTPAWSEKSFQAELSKKHANFWVVTDDETDQIIYAYIVFSHIDNAAHIQTFAVHPEHRRKKYGQFLLRRVIGYLLKKSAEKIFLEVRKGNEAAIKLYQSLGFIIIHQNKNAYPDGEEGFSMMYQIERDVELQKIRSQLTEDSEEFETDDAVRSKKNLN